MFRQTRGCAGAAAALAGAVLALAGPAFAQGNPDAADGVLGGHCATCHEVPGYPEPTRRYGLDAPTFQTIAANGSWYTRPRLLWILRDTHYPMDTFILSTTDVDNVIAYILRLGGH
jgi:mono/diheme cytochrome c family protein